MKKGNKLLFLLLITCLLITGCKKEENNPKENEPKMTEEEKIINNIVSEDLGTVYGEYSNRFTIIKITNKNDKDLYLDVKLTYFNGSNQLDEDDVYVYVSSGKSVYAVSKMYGEDPVFTSYKYETKYIKEVSGYSDIINGIKISKQVGNENLTVTMTNDGSRTTTVKGLIFFYKNNKIVAVSESVQYNLMPMSVKNEIITLPHKTLKELIPFDTVDVFVNEVSILL